MEGSGWVNQRTTKGDRDRRGLGRIRISETINNHGQNLRPQLRKNHRSCDDDEEGISGKGISMASEGLRWLGSAKVQRHQRNKESYFWKCWSMGDEPDSRSGKVFDEHIYNECQGNELRTPSRESEILNSYGSYTTILEFLKRKYYIKWISKHRPYSSCILYRHTI